MLINSIDFQYWIILFWCVLHFAWAERNANTELTDISEKHNHNRQHNHNLNLLDTQTNNQHSQLNSLNVYANNYDVITNGQRQYPTAAVTDFKPSYKVPDMQNNFKPTNLQNHQPIQMHPHNIQHEQTYQLSKPLEASVQQSTVNLAVPAPLLQYMPQVNNDQGIRYMQLIAARPILLPVNPVPSNVAGYVPSQPLTNANNYIDYTGRPISLVNPLPVNGATTAVLPIAKTPVIDISLRPGTFGLFTYAGASTNYKPNFRINRDIKEKLLPPASLSLNVNEYLPTMPTKMPSYPFLVRGRP